MEGDWGDHTADSEHRPRYSKHCFARLEQNTTRNMSSVQCRPTASTFSSNLDSPSKSHWTLSTLTSVWALEDVSYKFSCSVSIIWGLVCVPSFSSRNYDFSSSLLQQNPFVGTIYIFPHLPLNFKNLSISPFPFVNCSHIINYRYNT